MPILLTRNQWVMPRKPHAISPRTMSERAYQAIRKHKTLNPHELLFYWANGIEIAGLKPDPAQQIYCAVAAANYYAPKLSNIEIKQDVRVKAVISAAPMTQHQWAQKYLNQQSNTVSPSPLPNVVPTVAYEVTPTDPSLVHQNINSGEVTNDQSTSMSIESNQPSDKNDPPIESQ